MAGTLAQAAAAPGHAATLTDASGQIYFIGRPATAAPFQWLRAPPRQGIAFRSLTAMPPAVWAGRRGLPAVLSPGSGQASTGAARINCVPFARAESGIDLKGNAASWWDNAAGVYSRGHRPEPGSVLGFAASDRMPLGHVAVVSRVINNRLIAIDHANWTAGQGGPARGVPVMDVSPANDWTQVRVAQGRDGGFGSAYRTVGFIYNRPDERQMSANAGR